MKVNVYMDEHKAGVRTGNRILTTAELVKKIGNVIWVRLSNGDVVKRKQSRDCTPEDSIEQARRDVGR